MIRRPAGLTSEEIAKRPSASMLEWQKTLRKNNSISFSKTRKKQKTPKKPLIKKIVAANIQQTSAKEPPELSSESLYRLISIMGQIFHGMNTLFNPPQPGTEIPSEPSMTSIIAILNILASVGSKSSMLSQAAQYITPSPSTFSALSTPESNSLNIMFVLAAMNIHPEHFTFDSNETESNGLSQIEYIGFQFFQTFVRDVFDQWISFLYSKIDADNNMLFDQKNAFKEFFNGIKWAFAQLAEKRSLIEYYVDPEDKKTGTALYFWLKENSHQPDYQENYREFLKIDARIDAARNRAQQEFDVWFKSIMRRLMPDFANKSISQIIAEKKEEHVKTQRQKLEDYINNNFLSSKTLSPDFLLLLNDFLHRNECKDIFYTIVCESQSSSTQLHEMAHALYQIQELDSINIQPKEARSRMPNNSNFEYRINQSEAYKQWLKDTPLARIAGDIIMDAFDITSRIGSTFEVDSFVEELLRDVYPEYYAKRTIFTFEYHNLLYHFKWFILETILRIDYNTDFISSNEQYPLLIEKLKAASGDKENLEKIARKALADFKRVSQELVTLTGQISQSKKQIQPFVFGIGFNGGLFNSNDHHRLNKNEIWINFSQSQRTIGSDLFLVFLSSFSHDRDRLKFSPIQEKIKQNLTYYKPLIIYQIKMALGKIKLSLDEFPSKGFYISSGIRERFTETFLQQFSSVTNFEELSEENQNLLLNIRDWYFIPLNISIKTAPSISEAEVNAQIITRNLLFDVFSQFGFSRQNHQYLLDLSFIHWKGELIYIFRENINLINAIKTANNLSEIEENIDIVINKINGVFREASPALNFWIDEINDQFKLFKEHEIHEIYKRKSKRISDIDKEISKNNNAIEKIEKLNSGLKFQEKIEFHNEKIRQLNEEKEQLLKEVQDVKSTLPDSYIDLSYEQYEKFREFFFSKRNASQCIEPGFAKVLGHTHFFPVWVSGRLFDGNEVIYDDNGTHLTLGTSFQQSVIPPCNDRCQHHAMGHLSLGEAFSHQSADRLIQMRQGQGIRGISELFPTNYFTQHINNKNTHFSSNGTIMLPTGKLTHFRK